MHSFLNKVATLKYFPYLLFEIQCNILLLNFQQVFCTLQRLKTKCIDVFSFYWVDNFGQSVLLTMLSASDVVISKQSYWALSQSRNTQYSFYFLGEYQENYPYSLFLSYLSTVFAASASQNRTTYAPVSKYSME